MWYENTDKNADIVLSSKVIINRNIKGFPFPVRMTISDKENVLNMARDISGKLGLNYARIDELSDEAKEDMYKNYFLESKLLNESEGTGVLVDDKENTCVLINDRNHIEISTITGGSDVISIYKKADEIASVFEKEMDIAFSDRLGFLTSDISSVGMGVQISCLVSIPGIEKTANAITVLAKRLESYDWHISPVEKGTGIYGIVNTVMLGITEDELLERAQSVIRDVISLEKTCRSNICKRKPALIEDQFCRSYAILKYARRMELAEAMEYINWLRIGKGNIKENEISIDWQTINKLTLVVKRSLKEVINNNGRNPAFAQARSEAVRAILREES